jgi:hypothetical protein
VKMRLLTLLLLAVLAGSPAAQSLSFPEGLRAFRLNALVVDGIGPTAGRLLTVTGRRFDGRTVALFRGQGVSEERGLRCWFYLDDDLQALEVRVPGSAVLVAAVQTGTRIAVHGLAPAGLGSWYSPAAGPQELGPGDVRVLEAGVEDPEPLRAAGIHVLLLGTSGRPSPESAPAADTPQPAWRGLLLRAANPGAAAALLEREKERLLEFKERFLRLAAEARFYGTRRAAKPGEGALDFPGSWPPDVAYTLLREQLAVRVGAPLGLALLAFYSPVLAGAALFRRRVAALLLAGALLAGFVVFTVLRPGEARGLTVEFLLPQPGEKPPDVRLREIASASGSRAYRQEGGPAEGPRLLYRAVSVPGGELPLPPYDRELLVRFNQVPEVRQEEGRLLLAFRNPLASWSLHAAR